MPNATYTCNGIAYPATIVPEKEQLAIQLHREDAAGKVLWQYHNIRPTDRPHFFSYNDYPPQTLEVLEPALAASLTERIGNAGRYARAQRFGPLAKIGLLLLTVLVLGYVLVVPWLAGLLASRFPQSFEQQLGEQVYNTMKADFAIDEKATVTANRFFKALRFTSAQPVHITIVKGDVENAFALPGGHIVVYDKLLRGVDDYETFAALLAHEFVHVKERHTIRSLFRQLGGAIFLSLLIGDAGAVSATVLGNADELKNLSYSRKLETEADSEGVRLLAQSGISCGGFVRLFRFLDKQTGSRQPAEWMSSHPNLKKRIQNIQKEGCSDKASAENEQLRTLFLQLKTAD
jgi:Zn-dependent protease with chaperone function